MKELQIVTFSIGNELFSADTLQIGSIVKYEGIERKPGMPSYMDGIKNINGLNVPIIDIGRKFQMESGNSDVRKKIILTDIQGMQVGFTVDEVFEIMKFDEKDFEPVPFIIRKTGREYIKGVCKNNEKLVTVLDLGAVLSEDEVDIIKKMMI